MFYYKVGNFFLLFRLKTEFILKSVTIFPDFRDYYFLNRYQTIKTVNGTLMRCLNATILIVCSIYGVQYSLYNIDKAPEGRSLPFHNVMIELIHFEFKRLRLEITHPL